MKDPIVLGTVLSLNYHLIKTCRLTECSDFILSTQAVLQAIDDHYETHPHVAVSALICIKYLISQSNEIYNTLKGVLNSKTFFLKIGKILSCKHFVANSMLILDSEG